MQPCQTSLERAHATATRVMRMNIEALIDTYRIGSGEKAAALRELDRALRWCDANGGAPVHPSLRLMAEAVRGRDGTLESIRACIRQVQLCCGVPAV